MKTDKGPFNFPLLTSQLKKVGKFKIFSPFPTPFQKFLQNFPHSAVNPWVMGKPAGFSAP